jgi:hypothetical protein
MTSRAEPSNNSFDLSASELDFHRELGWCQCCVIPVNSGVRLRLIKYLI